jgi:uncharacterized protein (TIGR02145 family)
MTKSIFAIIATLGLCTYAVAQQTLTVNRNDTIHLNIDNARGQLQWEVTYDSLNWQTIAGATSAQYSTIADSLPAGYRLHIEEGSCDPLYSENLWVNESTPINCGVDSVGHGYVAGFTPDTSAQYALRTYSTVQANWGGPGGNNCWTKMNLGATAEADSALDPSPAAAGWYWQFNRAQAYAHDASGNRTPNTPWINPINEIQDWTPANDPCTQFLGSNWRLPTQAEWSNFLSASAANGGVGNGFLTDAFSSTLQIHGGGRASGGSGDLQDRGSQAYFWSSEENSNNTAGSFRFGSIGSFPVNATKNFGMAVRCICDCP